MKRRLFLLITGAALGTAAVNAYPQQALAPKRIGNLWPGKPDSGSTFRPIFVSRLRELGWTEGRNLEIVDRYTEGDFGRIDPMARELAAGKPDVVHAMFPGLVRAAQKAAPNTPIVFSIVPDPVAEGFVASLGRPGGNITGASTREQELYPKRIQLVRDLLPRAKRVAVLVDTPPQEGDPTMQRGLKDLALAGERIGVRIDVLQVGSVGEIGPLFDRMTRERYDALLVFVYYRLRGEDRRVLTERVARARLPAIYSAAQYVDLGGLMSYTVSPAEMARRAAEYVDKILRGARPADLPVEEPDTFELVVNKKAAQAMGLAIPQSILLSAERVIE